jgi:hypothetical protein
MREQPTQPNQEIHQRILKHLTRTYAVIWGTLCAARTKTDQLEISKEGTIIRALSRHGYIEVDLTTDEKGVFQIFRFVESFDIPNANSLEITIKLPLVYDELCIIVVDYESHNTTNTIETKTYLSTRDDTQSIYQEHLEPMQEVVQDFIDHEGQDLGYSFALETSYLDLSQLPYRPPESDNQS